MLAGVTNKLRQSLLTRPSLTQAYIAALILIACAMTLSYALLTHKVTKDIDKAGVINIAGMQRMLSQRIALMAREVSASDSAELTGTLKEKFSSALDRFDKNHAYLASLLTLNASPEITRLYAGPRGVEARSQQYISLGRQFQNLGKAGTDAGQQNQVMQQLVAIARNGFLSELDQVVNQYETEATGAVDNFLNTGAGCIGHRFTDTAGRGAVYFQADDKGRS